MRLALWFCALLLVIISFTGHSTKIHSDVMDLNEKFLDVMNNGMWLVKFYAPYCVHCKRLAPIWEHVAHALADKPSNVRVGKVDCTRFPGVASRLRVNAYPTIIFFRNGVQIPYEGERTKNALVEFVDKSSGPVIGKIENTAQLNELRKTADKDPFFVYVDGEDQSLFSEYDVISGKLFTETRFFRASQPNIFPSSVSPKKQPDVVLFKDGGHLTFQESHNEDQNLSSWVRSERWSLNPLITTSNVYTISEDTNKKLVLALVDIVDNLNSSSESGRFYKMFNNAAALARKDSQLREAFQFGWLDGNSMANSVIMGEMSVPNAFTFNVSSYEFYLFDDSPQQMSALSIVTSLKSLANGELPALGGRSWSMRFRRMGYEITKNVYEMFYHQPILTICLFGVPLAFFSIIIYSICSADFSVDRDEIYPNSEDELDDEENEEEVETDTQDPSAPLLRHRAPRQHYDENESSKSESEIVEQTNKSVDAAMIKKQVLEQLNGVNAEDKINFLINKLVNIDVETSKARVEVKELREQANQVGILQKKIGSLEKTLGKTQLAKTKLEELCRNLNNSKKEADRNYAKLRQIEESNRESMEHFKTSINEIQKSVETRKEQAQRMQDVEHLTTSLSNLSGEYEQRLKNLQTLYEEREQATKKMIDAKNEEFKHLLQENIELKKELMRCELKIKEVIESELATRKMVEGYSGKYNELMQTLEGSNVAFDKAKSDMEKMNAQLIKLQADSFKSKKKLEESQRSVLALNAQKIDFEKEITLKSQQIEKLKNLCRELQKGKVPSADAIDCIEPKEESVEDVEEKQSLS